MMLPLAHFYVYMEQLEAKLQHLGIRFMGGWGAPRGRPPHAFTKALTALMQDFKKKSPGISGGSRIQVYI